MSTNLIRRDIRSCTLTVGHETYPVVSFSVSFRLNEVPEARITVAVGRRFKDNKRVGSREVHIGSGDTAAELKLNVHGHQYTVLQGYAIQLTSGFTRTFGSGTTVGFLVKGLAFALETAPTASFLSLSPVRNSFTTMKNLLAQDRASLQGSQGAMNSNFPAAISSAMDDLDSRAATGDVAALYVDLLESLANRYNLGAQRGVLKPSDGIMDPFLYTHIRSTFTSHVLGGFFNNFLGVNALQALQQSTPQVFLYAVPHAKGAYLGHVSALNPKPDVILSGDEYIGIGEAQSIHTYGGFAGIAITNTMQSGQADDHNGKIFSYPEAVSGSGGDDPPLQGGWHFRAFPEAFNQGYEVELQNGVASGKAPKIGAKLGQGTFGLKASKEKLYQNASLMKTTGYQLAKCMYADEKLSHGAFTFTCPFRDDVMPGSVVKLQRPRGDDLDSIKLFGDIYGLIASTTINFNASPGAADLSVSCEVRNARGDADNGDSKFTSSTPGIYKSYFRGTTLEGRLKSGSTSSFDANLS